MGQTEWNRKRKASGWKKRKNTTKNGPEHPRLSRGGAIHKDWETKQKELKKKREIEAELKSHGMHVDYISKDSREEVEATYLVPRVENFVETKTVKDYGERIKRWLRTGYPVHIIGPTGCGKTMLAMNVAKSIGRPIAWVNGDESMSTTDLVGGYSQVEAEVLRDKYIHNVFKSSEILKADWIDNPLTLACKYGYTLVYNEFSRAKPQANNVLLSVLEEGILELPTKFGAERYIRVHPEFKAILTSNNVEYAGVHKPQDALLDRLIAIHMDYYDLETEVKIVRAHTKASEADAKKIVNVMRGLRKRMNIAERPGTRACIMAAQGLTAFDGSSKDHIEQACIDAIASKSKGFEDIENKRGIVIRLLSQEGVKRRI